MADVFDVAHCILDRMGEVTAMKLQKLCYYAQAWSLVWDEKPLFPNRIEAWANGPICPDLYRAHEGKFTITPDTLTVGDASRLTSDQRETVDAVIDFYGGLDTWQLSNLVHHEPPWRDARNGLKQGENGHKEISLAVMAEYYGGLADHSFSVACVS